VEPDSAWVARRRAAQRRPWWSFGAGGASVVDETASDAEIGRAQLVWANMALHLVVDPPALFARWHRLLDIDGIAVFSCLGPGTPGAGASSPPWPSAPVRTAASA